MTFDIFYASAIQYIALGLVYFYKRRNPLRQKQALILMCLGFSILIYSIQKIILAKPLIYISHLLYSFFILLGSGLIFLVFRESFIISTLQDKKHCIKKHYEDLNNAAISSLLFSCLFVYFWPITENESIPNLFATLNGTSLFLLLSYCLYIQFNNKNANIQKGLNILYFLIALTLIEKIKSFLPYSIIGSIALIEGIIYVVFPIFILNNLLVVIPQKKVSVSIINTQPTKISLQKDLLKNLDHNTMMKNFFTLFVVERIYLDEDLRLPTLADEMGMTVHQVSALINRQLKTKFNTLINYYRLREAINLLIEEPTRSITSIAFAVGFNGSSTFLRFFAYAINIRPSIYREKVLKGKIVPFTPPIQDLHTQLTELENKYLKKQSD
ncbi:AraC family transcriptional regulator [Leptospira yasudae]|uniref:AraC family transcriptional regulator n=1 Tax=Leptospira yasudae TaxID=2202201 RepID=UPI001C4F100B|nr:helix-turn-helix domain-containing protein [Leptospira yasudae]MBW0435191.1 AraC family transcriptional regulator [Leptospira yasudae]